MSTSSCGAVAAVRTLAAASRPRCRRRRGRRCTAARGACAFGQVELDVVGAGVDRLVGRELERRGAERRRVEAEHEVVHDRVADDHDVEHVRAVDAGRGARARRPLARAPARTAPVSSRGAAGVHHHVRHAAHQILAEPDLRVHDPGRREHLAGGEIAEVAGDRWSSRRRPRCRTRCRRSPGKTATIVGAPSACDRAARPSRAAARRRARRAARRARAGSTSAIVEALLLARARRAAGATTLRRRRAGGGAPRRQSVHDRVDDEIVERRPSLRTTGRCTWLAAGTSITTSPSERARCTPSRRAGVERAGEPRVALGRRRSGVERVGVGCRSPTSRTSPVVGRTLQWPQIARPSHTESRSTPSRRAASSTVVPVGDAALARPLGVNTTAARAVTVRLAHAKPPLATSATSRVLRDTSASKRAAAASAAAWSAAGVGRAGVRLASCGATRAT